MLSQRLLDRIAGIGLTVLGDLVETITVDVRTSPTATPTSQTVKAQIGEYRAREIDQETILRTDQRCRVRTADVTWTPTLYDTVVRSDGTTWKVMHVADGPGRPWYFFQLRQVG